MSRKTQDMQAIDRYVGARIRWYRIQRGLSQDQLARRLGISYQQLHKYEMGSSSASASRLAEIAEALGVPVSYLFDGVDDRFTVPTLRGHGKEKLLLLKYFNQIKNPQHRHILRQLVHGLANANPPE